MTGPDSSRLRTDALVSDGVPRSNHSSKSSVNGSSTYRMSDQPGAREQVDQLSAGQVSGVRPVARDFEGRVMGRDGRVGVGEWSLTTKTPPGRSSSTCRARNAAGSSTW